MIDRASYVPPFAIGKVMQGGSVGEVVASENENYNVGDHVQSMASYVAAILPLLPQSVLADKLPSDFDLPFSAILEIVGMLELSA